MKALIAALVVTIVAMIGGAYGYADATAIGGAGGFELGPGFTTINVDHTLTTATSAGWMGGIAHGEYLQNGAAVSFLGFGAVMGSGGASTANAASVTNVAHAASDAEALAIAPNVATTTTAGTTDAVATLLGSAAASTSFSNSIAI